jgi:hypothetical protein
MNHCLRVFPGLGVFVHHFLLISAFRNKIRLCTEPLNLFQNSNKTSFVFVQMKSSTPFSDGSGKIGHIRCPNLEGSLLQVI